VSEKSSELRLKMATCRLQCADDIGRKNNEEKEMRRDPMLLCNREISEVIS